MTAVDLTTDTGTIEHLDFEPTIPCEHGQHATRHADEPAMFLVRRHTCVDCGARAKDYALCLSGWVDMSSGGRGMVHCIYCRNASPTADSLTILRVIGGPR